MTAAATLDSVDDQLEKRLRRAAALQSKWLQERDTLIVTAFASGAGVREIGRAVGMSHPAVLHILKRNGMHMERDLVVPISKGGTTDEENVDWLSPAANREKGDQMPDEA